MKKILITGAAGFIGYHLSKRLIEEGHEVVGIDSLNNYYDINLKLARVDQLRNQKKFRFYSVNICDKEALNELFEVNSFDIVVNLAAQAGVRYSIEKPYKYADSNLIGFLNVLEACRCFPVQHLLFASSSSVYGLNSAIPFSVGHSTDMPASLYAATKKANELMAYSYALTHQIPCTGMRFFTVYGPFGRPDMAYFSFTKNIMAGKPIQLYNHGNMERDFTYIDDVVTSVSALMRIPPKQEPDQSDNCYRIVNIGNNNPVNLLAFVQLLERYAGKKAVIELKPMQPGDIACTYANIDNLKQLTGFTPETTIDHGLSMFVNWYKEYYY